MITKFSKQFQYQKKNVFKNLLRKIYRRIDIYFNYEETIFLNKNPKYDGIEIGDYTYGNSKSGLEIMGFGENSTLKIGKFCCIAEDVKIIIGGGDHNPNWITTYPFNIFFEEVSAIDPKIYGKKGVIIENDVWIGRGAVIMPGVKVGNGAIIGSYTIVSKDVPPYHIIVGNPGKVIKKRFNDEEIANLQTLQWWNWDIEKIKRNMTILLSSNVNGLIEQNSI